MIFFVGGAPRTGKSILCQRIAAQRRIGWISTDLLMELLRFNNVPGTKASWNAAPEAIRAAAEWFFPCLERFVWGVNSLANSYTIEGVDFLPEHIQRLSVNYPVRGVFLGCSKMTQERFDQFPGRSRGYSGLPEETRRQFAQDIPRWSEFVRQEAERCGLPYIDMSDDFSSRLYDAEAILLNSL